MKKLLIIISFVIAGSSVSAQHFVNLTNGNVIYGKITHITDQYITIMPDDSVKVYDCPYSQIASYNIGSGPVYLNNVKGTTSNNPLSPKPGDELILASKAYYGGIITSFVGISVALIGQQVYQPDDNDTQKILEWKSSTRLASSIIGYGIAGVGMIIQLTAFSHIGKAGHRLNATANSNGVGVSMKF